MLYRAFAIVRCLPTGEAQDAEIDILQNDGAEGQLRKKQQVALHKLVPGKPEDVESEVNPKDRIRQSKGTAVREAQKGVPLTIKAGGKEK